MRDLSRRGAVKLAAGLTVGAGTLAAQSVRGDDPKKPADDPQLERAVKNPEGFLFAEQVTFQTSTTEPYTFDLVFTSARDPQGNPATADVRPGTMRVFRADAGRDDFTKQGGVYWKCGKATGKFRFKEPGALVLAVREMDGTVRCYALAFDFRC